MLEACDIFGKVVTPKQRYKATSDRTNAKKNPTWNVQIHKQDESNTLTVRRMRMPFAKVKKKLGIWIEGKFQVLQVE